MPTLFKPLSLALLVLSLPLCAAEKTYRAKDFPPLHRNMAGVWRSDVGQTFEIRMSTPTTGRLYITHNAKQKRAEAFKYRLVKDRVTITPGGFSYRVAFDGRDRMTWSMGKARRGFVRTDSGKGRKR